MTRVLFAGKVLKEPFLRTSFGRQTQSNIDPQGLLFAEALCWMMLPSSQTSQIQHLVYFFFRMLLLLLLLLRSAVSLRNPPMGESVVLCALPVDEHCCPAAKITWMQGSRFFIYLFSSCHQSCHQGMHASICSSHLSRAVLSCGVIQCWQGLALVKVVLCLLEVWPAGVLEGLPLHPLPPVPLDCCRVSMAWSTDIMWISSIKSKIVQL